MNYDPDAPLHDRYRVDRDFLEPADMDTLSKMTMVINAFFGWDFNSCEALRSNGIWCPIDFANACPDSQVTSLHYHFPWLIMANLRWSIYCAATDRSMHANLNWGDYFEIAAEDQPFEQKLDRYADLAFRYFEYERFIEFCDRHLAHLAESAWEFFGSNIVRDAIRDKVESLYPEHEWDEFTELFWSRIQDWRASRRGFLVDKINSRWASPRVEQEVHLVRYGHYGTPILLFPTAGGDAEEAERFHLIGALEGLINDGRIKVYSTDSIAGRAWLSKEHSPEFCSLLQNRFDAMVYEEILPAIRTDCQSEDVEVIAAGASIGAFNAVATVCRHPDAFRAAVAMSGTYDLSKYLDGRMNENFYFSSPLHYLPDLEGPQLDKLKQRFVLMPSGEGDYEDIGESWRLASVLGAKGVPNRVDPWGRGMAPRLGDLASDAAEVSRRARLNALYSA